MTAPASSPGRRALLIAIDAYAAPTRPLGGCVNDAKLVADVLKTHFAFDDITIISNADATRKNVLQGLEHLLTSTQPGDNVVIYYAGHGSTIADREGDETSGFDSTWHVVDSGGVDGSGTYLGENRDIIDDEIALFLRRFAERTDRLTVVVDACHSGGISRDASGGPSRATPGDPRTKDQLPPSPIPEELWKVPNLDGKRISWGVSSNAYVLIAGCRDAEESKEVLPDAANGRPDQHGALTWFLTRALLKADATTTYRDVFEDAATSVTRNNASQHPQMEGRVDRTVFGLTDLPAGKYQLITERSDASEVTIAAGIAHGVTVGSTYAVYPKGAKGFGSKTLAPIGEVEITTVGSVESHAQVTREDAKGVVTALCRAVETRHVFTGRRWEIAIQAPAELSSHADALRTALNGSIDVSLSEAGTTAEFTATLLPTRSTVAATDPFPALGPLTTPTWVLGDAKGLRLAPLSPAGEEAVVASNAATLARWHRLRHLQNDAPASGLRGKIRLDVQWKYKDQWQDAEFLSDGETAQMPAGSEFRFVVRKADETVPNFQITIMDLDPTGVIARFWPDATEAPMAVAEYIVQPAPTEDRWTLPMPDGYPMEALSKADGQYEYASELFLVIATLKPADFTSYAQAGTIARASELAATSRAASKGTPRPIDDWAVAERMVRIWRPRGGASAS